MNIVKKQYNNAIINFDLSNDLMINLTEMAKAQGKEVKDWLRLDSTKSYLEKLKNSEGGKMHITIVKGNHKDGRPQGTWGSKRVAIRLAQWLSDDFAIWVDTQIEELMTNGAVSLQPKTALELAKEQVALLEALEAKQIELDHAIKTKAYISDTKTATAMNTASQAVKKVNKLEIELGKSKDYATIKRVEKATGLKYKWKLLKDYSKENNLEITKVFDRNYEHVNAYHADAWYEVYSVDILELI